MEGLPPRCVVDTSVLVDLHTGNMMSALFELPCDFLTPDVIVGELQEPDGRELMERGLQQGELTGDQVQEVASLRARYTGVSVNDLFALVLARAKQATLLTSDRNLRNAAFREGVPVHGTLWVLEQLVGSGNVSPFRARDALELMLSKGRRLPRRECDRLLIKWRAG